MLFHRYEAPTRFVAGTVGQPGERQFFLQAREGDRVTSVTLEKEQVGVLAQRLVDLLAQVEETTGVMLAPSAELDRGPLDQPLTEEFRVGTMTLAWDEALGCVVIEAFALADEDEESSDVLVVQLPADAARAFAARAESVLSAGREQCPFCGGPIDLAGHLCPRANGFRRVRGT